MLFKGVYDQTVEFKIADYQFPEITDCKYDSNWLLVYLKVNSNFGSWEAVDPSLLVSNVKSVIEWFKRLLENETLNSPCLSFLEPNLEFELTKTQPDLKTVRIKFDMESRPPNADDRTVYFVDCEFNQEDLKSIIIGLEKELKPYPERAVG